MSKRAAGSSVKVKVLNATRPESPLDTLIQEEIENASYTLHDLKTDSVQKTAGNLEDGIRTVDNGIASLQEGTVGSVVSQIADVAKSTPEGQAIAATVGGFIESSKILIGALDDLSKIHPFISVAVIAFKAVITLELKRRENDRKVLALKHTMCDMMNMLLQLGNVADPEQQAPDGTTVKGRVQALLGRIAGDIKSCGNACDTYMKKRAVVRFLKGPVYEGILAEFAETFGNRRKELELALTIHITVGVDAANLSIQEVNRSVQSVDEKLNLLLRFRQLESPLEKELMKAAEARGGVNACLESDKALKELDTISTKRSSKPSVSVKPGESSAEKLHTAEKSFASLKEELNEDIDRVLEKNMSIFGKKLEVQKRQIAAEMAEVVARESDRVISAIVSGPHDRIKDSDLHTLWMEMGWKGSVKGRHFVLAIIDYFAERVRSSKLSAPNTTSAPPSPPPSSVPVTPGIDVTLTADLAVKKDKSGVEDEWALAYINILHVQPLLEAFDDDATGFVSIKEANAFSSSRPKDWSLERWIAYWSAGWPCSVCLYKWSISGIIHRMYQLLESDLLPENQTMVAEYLGHHNLSFIELIVENVSDHYFSLVGLDLNDKLIEYTTSEEARMQKNLEEVSYFIDDMNTLKLITGPGRIDRYIMQLLYLILRRHLFIIKLGCTVILDDEEMESALISLGLVLDAAFDRIRGLTAICKHKNIDVDTELGHFAFGMYKLLREPWNAVGPSRPPMWGFYGDAEEIEDDDKTSILRNFIPVQNWSELSLNLPAVVPNMAAPAIEGQWIGFSYVSKEKDTDGMFRLEIGKPAEEGHFEGRGFIGVAPFAIEGTIEPNETSGFKVSFTKTFNDKTKKFCEGTLDGKTGVINGTWNYEDTADDYGPLYLIQMPPSAFQFRYSDAQFTSNPARARWTFAIDAILYQVKQRLWLWKFMKAKCVERRRYIDLYTRSKYEVPEALNDATTEEYKLLNQRLPADDNSLYRSVSEFQRRKLTAHINACCDSCGDIIIGKRTTCLQCIEKDMSNHLDLCAKCVDKPVTGAVYTHVVGHPMVRMRQFLHNRSQKDFIEAARKAADRLNHRARSAQPVEGNQVPIESTTVDLLGGKNCASCKSPISAPFWFCVKCEEDIFICDVCENNDVPWLPRVFPHHENHALLRYHDVVKEEAKTMEAKFLALETRFASFEERLGVIEELLRVMAAKG